jgi:hypothetical protein
MLKRVPNQLEFWVAKINNYTIGFVMGQIQIY